MTADLIDLAGVPLEDLMDIIDLAERIGKNPSHYSNACAGKVMASLFYEPSTRTQMSFHSAMIRLGGQVIGFDNPGGSSVSKGESFGDTVRVTSGYSDILVIRHPAEGAALAASLYSKVPVINAGDGSRAHPTQTLTDIVTLASEKRLGNLAIGICGDLLNGRTVHSLIETMSRFEGNKFILISTPDLALPVNLKNLLNSRGCLYKEVYCLEEALPDLDVLYMTRIQRERFENKNQYEAQMGIYILTSETLKYARPDLCILHPLPRLNEIDYSVDADPRAFYFKQAEYGMYARMALLCRMIKGQDFISDSSLKIDMASGTRLCSNAKCITANELYLPQLTDEINGKKYCRYCEHVI